MKTRELGNQGLSVSALGLGCMGMTPLYGVPDPQEAQYTLHEAIDKGITLVDTADAYSGGKNEELVGKAIQGRRQRICLATKFGNVRFPDGSSTINGKPEYVAEACDKSLLRLGTDHIDLYYVHRIDPEVPIEDTIGAMARLVEAGKIKYLGLSEAGTQTITRAHATHPITALQTEYSIATRDVEDEILPLCRDLGIGFVAYSPLSRGLMSGLIRNLDELAQNDRRRAMPRFQEGNLDHNLKLVDAIGTIASQKGVSGASVSLAWLLAMGEDIVPIPGCSRRKTLADSLSALDILLSEEDFKCIGEAGATTQIKGTRYPPKQMIRLGL